MARTNNFGIALRGWRERLSPLETGLEVEGQRRIPGLRREELARLAGLSVDYVVRLEQGRARHPSAQVVSALAGALRLATSERDHLFRCAELAPPVGGTMSTDVPMRVHRLMHRLGAVPVAVFAADWTIIGWNSMWTALVGGPGSRGKEERNLVADMFPPAGARRLGSFTEWPVRSWQGVEAEEEALVADLRRAAAAYPDDRRLASLVERTVRASPRFARLWFTGGVSAFEGDRKTIEHPLVGDIALDLDVLLVPGADVRIVTYAAAADSTDEEKMNALRTSCLPRTHRLEDTRVRRLQPVPPVS